MQKGQPGYRAPTCPSPAQAWRPSSDSCRAHGPTRAGRATSTICRMEPAEHPAAGTGRGAIPGDGGCRKPRGQRRALLHLCRGFHQRSPARGAPARGPQKRPPPRGCTGALPHPHRGTAQPGCHTLCTRAPVDACLCTKDNPPPPGTPSLSPGSGCPFTPGRAALVPRRPTAPGNGLL